MSPTLTQVTPPLAATVLQEVPVGVGIASLDGRLLSANRTLVTILGLRSEEDAEGISLASFHRTPELAADVIRERIDNGVSEHFDLDIVRADGMEVTVSVRGRLTTLAGVEQPVVVFSADDVTSAREDRERSTQGHKMEAVVRFAGGIAHEYNNLLAAIIGEAEELLASGHTDAEDGVTHILEAARRGGEITERLLVFSRSELSCDETLSVTDLISEVADRLRAIAGQGVEVVLRLDRDVALVRIDQERMTQVLVSLVENARNAMPGGGRIVLETTNVPAPEETEGIDYDPPVPPGDYVSIAVGDTGIGMNADTRMRVFDPFFTTKPLGGGAGLGLTTVYGHVLRARGHVSVISAPAHGTLVKILLPVHRADQTALPPELARHAPGPTERGEPRILVVDDEAPVRRVIERALKRRGYSVVGAPSGVSAMNILRGSQSRFDVVITDVMMPGMDGAELARWIRSEQPGASVLFVSGFADVPQISAWLTWDPDALLAKPFEVTELVKRVEDRLNRRDLKTPRRSSDTEICTDPTERDSTHGPNRG
jgi:two-component system cell cycle sensor histidine kinase/response regulator CckA